MIKIKSKLSYSLIVSVLLIILLGCRGQNPVDGKQKWIDKIDSLNRLGYRITDLHAHLKGGLTTDELIKYSEETGIKYGVAANCGVGFPIQDDSTLSAYFHQMKKYPVYKGMQAEGREWVNLFNPDSVAMFDYVFTDAMTFFDEKGRRTRLWINDEVYITNADSFMMYYVKQIEQILNNEPVDIYVNPTFLPEVIRDSYDKLWTRERMKRVVYALKNNNIALEINTRYKIPSRAFIQMAKDEGVKFTLGTNNVDNNLGLLEYGVDMIDKCKLKPDDFWLPDK